MRKAGVFVKVKENKKIQGLIEIGKIDEARAECNRLATSYGLPGVEGNYGITKSGELIAPTPPRIRTLSRAEIDIQWTTNPVCCWILGYR